MSSKNEEKESIKSSAKKESFTFGEYVSPNPKPIPLGIKLKIDPLIQYKTDKIVKTESKIIESDNNDKNIKKPIPLKEKVKKQQKEIESLESAIFKLQIENEENEENDNDNKSRKHIVFNPSVQIMDDLNNKKGTILTDKVSFMRSNRNSTPYKPKQKRIEIKERNITHESSRSDYRITPIPTKRHQKKIIFKSKLQSISDLEIENKENKENNKENKENKKENKENIKEINGSNDELSINDLLETPTNIRKLRQFATPNPNISSRSSSSSTSSLKKDISFNFGVEQVLDSDNNNSSILIENTPDFNMNPMGNGNGASNVTSPILTPMKGIEKHRKPFIFSWNKNKRCESRK